MRRAPGPGFHGLVAVNTCLLLWGDSYPGGSLIVAGSLIGWLAIGGWWTVRFLAMTVDVVRAERNPYSFPDGWRMWFLAPAVVVLTASLVLIRAPLRLRFGLSRCAFERAVETASGPQSAQQGRLVGLYRVDRISRDGGLVYFSTGYDMFDEHGFVWAPNGRPVFTQALGGGWYTYVIPD